MSPSVLNPARIQAVLLALGVLLRVFDFALVRSLWLDEAMLARNIIDRSPSELLQPLDHDQAAPVGFLLAQKAVISVFGTGEAAFRLLPALLGIRALFLFARLSRAFLGSELALRILPFFAFNPFLAGATNKQYPVDVWAALALVSLAWRALGPSSRRRDYVLLAIGGACLVWISHPVALVAAGVGTAVMIDHARARRWGRFAMASAASACWLAGFMASYLLVLRHVQSNRYLVAYWSLGFPPTEGGTPAFIRWTGRTLQDALIIPGRISPVQVGAALMLLGLIRLTRDPVRFGVIALAPMIAFGAAIAGQFPFQARLVLFLTPFFYWMMAAGFGLLTESRSRAIRLLGWSLLVSLLWHPMLDVKNAMLKPETWEESREVLAAMRVKAEPGDLVFVHPNGRHTFEYYRSRFDFNGLETIHAHQVPPADAARQLRELPRERRIWVFHSELRNGACPIVPLTRGELLAILNETRLELVRYEAAGVCVVLFGPAVTQR